MNDVKLPFGRRGERLVHISEVERGLACGCRCPCCNCELVAKKGSTAHHFAHHNAEEPCEFQPETALHKYAKQLVADQVTITVPPLPVQVRRPEHGIELQETIPGVTLQISDRWVELPYEDVVPDVQLETNEGRLFVELAVTSFADPEKRNKLRGIGLPAMEISLRGIAPEAPLERIHFAVLEDMSRRSWIHHARQGEIQTRLIAEVAARLRLREDRSGKPVPPATPLPPIQLWDGVAPNEDQDPEGRKVISQAEEVDATALDAELRPLPRLDRLNLYAAWSPAEKVAYHCHLFNCPPRMLPSWFNNREGGSRPFREPAIVWRTGIYLRYVAKYQASFTVGDVAAWCLDRYPVGIHFSERVQEGQAAHWSVTHGELAIFNWLSELEKQEYLDSDGFIPRRRQFQGAGKQLTRPRRRKR